MLAAALAYAVWWSVVTYQHRIIVVLPDGTPAANASVCLDYDPVYAYDPTRLTGSQTGIVYISRRRAYRQGWDWMRISASVGSRHYSASRYPSDCNYPMTVVLEEVVPQQSLLQKLGNLIYFVRQSVKPAAQ